ncbi:MAG TPA: hypothetical protein VIJ42_05740, partial [Stellaceae bacterium]
SGSQPLPHKAPNRPPKSNRAPAGTLSLGLSTPHRAQNQNPSHALSPERSAVFAPLSLCVCFLLRAGGASEPSLAMAGASPAKAVVFRRDKYFGGLAKPNRIAVGLTGGSRGNDEEGPFQSG